MKLSVVLISGKQGVGKTTTQKALQAALMKREKTLAMTMNFADELYLIHNFALNRLKEHGIVSETVTKDGKLLQLLGTEWGRQTVSETIWVDIVISRIQQMLEMNKDRDGHLVVIIGDCRFKNEFDAFPNAFKVRLDCLKDTRKERCTSWRENDTHPSEVDLDQYFNEGRFDRTFRSDVLNTEQIVADILERI